MHQPKPTEWYDLHVHWNPVPMRGLPTYSESYRHTLWLGRGPEVGDVGLVRLIATLTTKTTTNCHKWWSASLLIVSWETSYSVSPLIAFRAPSRLSVLHANAMSGRSLGKALPTLHHRHSM